MNTLFCLTKRTSLKNTLALLLIVSFLLPPAIVLTQPKQVEAQLVVTDPGNTLQSALSAASDYVTAAFTTQAGFKEYVLDPIAWFIAKSLISAIMRSTINWVNSGFQGSPAYVTDFNAFLQNAADEALGEVIYRNIPFLCSPYRLRIQGFLLRQKKKTRVVQCTLTKVAANFQNFLNGVDTSLRPTNWREWVNITANPQNNIAGNALILENELSISIEGSKQIKLFETQLGNGILSFRDPSCVSQTKKAQEEAYKNIGSLQQTEDYGPEGGGSYTTQKREENNTKLQVESNCPITTPGNIISTQINKQLGLTSDSLVSADEINELVGALASQLIQGVLGSTGLFGLSQKNNTQNSFLDRLASEPQGNAQAITSKAIELKQVSDQEGRYLRAKQDSLTAVNSADKSLKDLLACQLKGGASAGKETTDLITNRITPLKGPLEEAVASSTSRSLRATQIEKEIDSSKGAPVKADQQIVLLQEYQKLSTYMTPQEAARAETERETIVPAMKVLQTQAEEGLNKCQNPNAVSL